MKRPCQGFRANTDQKRKEKQQHTELVVAEQQHAELALKKQKLEMQQQGIKAGFQSAVLLCIDGNTGSTFLYYV